MLIIARIISSASGSLLVVLCVTIASNIVTEKYRARAIGVVFMGVSASLVLGIPIGLMLGNSFDWRVPFILITLLTLVSLTCVHFFMGKIDPKPSLSIAKQLGTLKNRKILLAQWTTFFIFCWSFNLICVPDSIFKNGVWTKWNVG